jgi:hypothetical protein
MKIYLESKIYEELKTISENTNEKILKVLYENIKHHIFRCSSTTPNINPINYGKIEVLGLQNTKNIKDKL